MLWSLEKKLTVADSGGNIPYVFQEMVTKVIWNEFRQSDLHEIRFHMSAWVVFISEGEGGSVFGWRVGFFNLQICNDISLQNVLPT